MGGIDYWQDETVNCWGPRLAGSVMEAQSHDEGRKGRSVIGVYRSATGMVHGFQVYYNVWCILRYGNVIYYIKKKIAILCVSVCVCMCVCVISNSSETGGRSTMPLSPTCRASPGELHQLLLELTQCVVREEKPLELFRW